ncbi:carbonic anhydrase [Phocaeicola sp.]|uniref:beta-class carbonic anhydrase n=1 Tax=Phocaeicola sp. TaxID=2773926 RepID=UPI002843DE6A|nr:carbonic anhydrase [Phocaeicola sp.]MDR3794187.1 carbonic anhydrase [Phocaeicola sp.]
MIDELLHFNKTFVESKGYEKYITNKYPDKKIAIVTCMDTRLTELLPAALGIKNGDVKIIKNAGGTITHPFGSAMRSLLVAIYELGVEEVMIIGHTDCGVQHMDSQVMLRHMRERGISQDHIEMMQYCDIDLNSWLSGFNDTEEAVQKSVHIVRHHPLVPQDIRVRGFIMDSTTGNLTEVQAD